MMHLPEGNLFSSEHLWLRMFDKKIHVGFTNKFLNSLGRIDIVDIRDGVSFNKGELCGIIYGKNKFKNMIMPVSGTILSVNMNVFLDPTIFNNEPYRHWIILIDVVDQEELKQLLSYKEYKNLINVTSL